MASQRAVAIITGASSGIGAATARMFAGRNYAVSLAGRNIQRLDNVAQQCKEAAGRGDCVLSTDGDLGDDKHLASLVGRTVDKYGRIDVLINNAAGVFESGDPDDWDNMDAYDKTMHVNIRSVVQLTNKCEKHLIKTKGNIINVSSVAANEPTVTNPYYSMSKAAMDIYTKSLSLKMAPHGVRANVVSPGAVDTPAITGMVEEEGFKDLIKLIEVTHPVGRMGTSDEVAELIAFLADNDKAAFITGAVFLIDGGLMVNSAFNTAMSMAAAAAQQ